MKAGTKASDVKAKDEVKEESTTEVKGEGQLPEQVQTDGASDKNSEQTQTKEPINKGEEDTETNKEDSDVQVCVECDSTNLTIRDSGLVVCNDCHYINRDGLDDDNA